MQVLQADFSLRASASAIMPRRLMVEKTSPKNGLNFFFLKHSNEPVAPRCRAGRHRGDSVCLVAAPAQNAQEGVQ